MMAGKPGKPGLGTQRSILHGVYCVDEILSIVMGCAVKQTNSRIVYQHFEFVEGAVE